MDVNFEATAFNVVAGALGGFLCLYGALSFLIKERLFLGEPPLAVLVGIIIERLNVIPQSLFGRPGSTDEYLDDFSLGFSRAVLGIQLVLVGIQLPYKYLHIEWRSLAMLLFPVLLAMWFVTTGLMMLVLPNVPLLVALVIASCTTPTDPVLSNAIITGSFADQHISPRIRNLISAESGANDGLGYPFLFLALRLIKAPSTSEALSSWFLKTVVYQVGGAVVFGALVGFAANRILHWATRHNTMDKESFLCYGIAVGVFTVGVAGFLDLDDLLAAFVAGNATTWDDWYRKETEEQGLDSEVGFLLDTSFFLYIGATIPWHSFSLDLTGVHPKRLVLLGVLVLLFRRLPAMMLAYRFIPRIKTWSEAALMGYFGPIGAGAIFYASLVIDQIQRDDLAGQDGERILDLVKPVTYALVLASLLGHSMLIPFVKMVFSYYGVGNVKLVGNEGDRLADDDSDIDLDETQSERAASETASIGEAEEQRASTDDGSRTGAEMTMHPDAQKRGSITKHPLYLYPDGQGSYLLNGQYVPQASWRMSSAHGPSAGYHFDPDAGANRSGSANHYHRARWTTTDNDLPRQWNDRVRYLDEETGNCATTRSQDGDDDGARFALQHSTDHQPSSQHPQRALQRRNTVSQRDAHRTAVRTGVEPAGQQGVPADPAPEHAGPRENNRRSTLD